MHPHTNLRITITIYVVVIEGLDILPHFHLKTTNKDIWWPNILTSESEFDFVITIGAISVAGTALTKATTKVSKEKTGKKKKVKETQTSTTDVSTTLKKKKINELVCSHSLPAELQTVCREFHKRLAGLESEKYDLEWKNKMKNLEVITRYQSPNRQYGSIQSSLKALTHTCIYIYVYICILVYRNIYVAHRMRWWSKCRQSGFDWAMVKQQIEPSWNLVSNFSYSVRWIMLHGRRCYGQCNIMERLQLEFSLPPPLSYL